MEIAYVYTSINGWPAPAQTKISCAIELGFEQEINSFSSLHGKSFFLRRQEEIKKLNEESSEAYMDSDWADTTTLKRSLMGISEVKLGPRFK